MVAEGAKGLPVHMDYPLRGEPRTLSVENREQRPESSEEQMSRALWWQTLGCAYEA